MNTAMVGIFISICAGALGQLFIKSGMQKFQMPETMSFESLMVLSPHMQLEIYFGILLYSGSVFSWVTALRRYDLNFAYPFLAISYVLVYLLAAYWPGIEEGFSHTKTAGVLLVVIGVIFAVGERKSNHE